MNIVVDASAVGKLALEEPFSDAMRAWASDQGRRGVQFHAPVLLLHEVAALLVKNCRRQIKQDPMFLPKIGLWMVDGIELSEVAWQDIGPYIDDVTSYDASYLAMAAVWEYPLVTYDRHLAKVAEARGVQVIMPGA